MTSFQDQARQCASEINEALDQALSAKNLSAPGPVPERLIASMRHGTLNGGKRWRPLLLRQSAEIFGVPASATIIAGLAVEMVHSYSLIHDDLPAMDDDDLRRGKPTVHIAFDEATAILAGDNLLTLAFNLLASTDCHFDAELRMRLVAELAQGAGAGGMVGGQMRDLEGEGSSLNEDEITTMQAMKTGALIRASVRMGAIMGGASKDELLALTGFSEAAGRAFQLADDILDETATKEQLGKATGKDQKRGKSTLVAHVGIDAARVKLAEIIDEAIEALAIFDEKADGLRSAAIYFGEREN